MNKLITLSFLLTVFLSISTAHAITRECIESPTPEISKNENKQELQGKIPYPEIDVKQIFEIFLEAVDKGELIIFDKQFDRTMLQPEFVEYIYSLEFTVPIVRVYSMLKPPISFPSKPELSITGISGVLDKHGEIIEIILHCGQ